MADVSVDALQKVKSALSTFQSDIAGISLRASNQSQNCLNACRQKVDETQAKIEELESAITKIYKGRRGEKNYAKYKTKRGKSKR